MAMAVTASAIRKRVREAERDRLKAREDSAVTVAQRLAGHAAAREALAAAEADLTAATKEALSHYDSLAELARVLDVSPSVLRQHKAARVPSPATTSGAATVEHDTAQ